MPMFINDQNKKKGMKKKTKQIARQTHEHEYPAHLTPSIPFLFCMMCACKCFTSFSDCICFLC